MYTLRPNVPPMVQEDDMEMNASIYHQRVIAQLTAGLYPLYKAGTIPYEPFPEMMVGEESSPTPDVVLYDNTTEQVRVIIEVCQNKGLKHDLNKVVRLVDEDGILEGFVYNYKTHEWFRYHKGGGSLPTESAFSTVLNLDLSVFLR